MQINTVFLVVVVVVDDDDLKDTERVETPPRFLTVSFQGMFVAFRADVHMTSDRNSYVRNAKRELDREVQTPAPLSPRHSLPATAGNGRGWRIWGRHVDTGFVLFCFFSPLKKHLNLFSLCQQTAPLFMSLFVPRHKGPSKSRLISCEISP